MTTACSGTPSPESDARGATQVSVAAGVSVVDDPVVDGAMTWRHVPLGAGGFVTGITSLPRLEGGATTYARTDVGGAYRWSAPEQRWIQMLRVSGARGFTLAPDDMSVASLAAAPSDPNVVFAAVGGDYDPAPDEPVPSGGRVLRSADGGATWTSSEQRWFVNGNGFDRVGSERLAIHPDDPAIVAFATQREGLWLSDDGGTTWSQVADDVVPFGQRGDRADQQSGVSSVAFGVGPEGTRLTVGVTGVGVFESTDDGSTFGLLTRLDPDERTGIIADVDGRRVIGTFRDDGADARILQLDGPNGPVDVRPPSRSSTWITHVDPADPRRWVVSDGAVRDGHLWTSLDAGDNWQVHDISIRSPEIPWLEATDQDTYMAVGAFTFDGSDPDLLWFAEGTGVWTTDELEPEVTWTFRSLGLEELVVTEIVVPRGGPVYVLVADRQGFVIDSPDRYPSRTIIDERFASGSSLDYSTADPARVAWVGAESNIPDSPDREPRGAVSTDGGRTWVEMGDLDDDMYGGEIAVSATDPDLLVWRPSHPTDPTGSVDEPLGLRVSADGGRSWDRVDLADGNDGFLRYFWWFTRRSLVSDRVDGSFYLMSDDARFYRSVDGSSWARTPHAPPCSLESACHVFGQVAASPDTAAKLYASTGSAGLHTTSDAGATPWERIPGIADARAIAIGPTTDGAPGEAVFVHGFADGDERLGLWMTENDGEDWTLLSRSPYGLSTAITSLAADPDVPGRVYVGFSGSGAVVGDLDE